MQSPFFATLVLIVTGTVPHLCAQQSTLDLLSRAATLNDSGEFRAALELVQPLLGPNAPRLDNATAGVLWDIRGLALQNLGNSDESRRSYETAIRILRALPDQTIQYATAINNLGSLEAENGQLIDSRVLRMRAKELFASVGDHAGVARTASTLAFLLLAMGKRKEARQSLEDAHQQESLVSVPDTRDLAWMSATECLLDEAEGHFRTALDQINHAMDLWTRRYGPKYYVLAAGYTLRGRLYHELHDDLRAQTDLQDALVLLSENHRENSAAYFSTRIMYAQVLRNSGGKGDTSAMESEAREALARLRHQQCGSCTISAEGIR